MAQPPNPAARSPEPIAQPPYGARPSREATTGPPHEVAASRQPMARLGPDVGARASSAPNPAALAVWAAALGLGGFVALTALLLAHVAMPFDPPLLDAASRVVGDGSLWRFISESSNWPLVVIGVGMVLLLFVRGHRKDAVLVALLLIAVTAGSEGVKQLVARPRPEGTDPNIPGVVYSFPSGHVLEALTIYGVIAIHLARTRLSCGVLAVVCVLVVIDVAVVGFARMALRAHYPSDVLGSLLAGMGMLGVYVIVSRHFLDRERSTAHR
jgi:undecaprenyl-diphosphatase